MRDKPLESSPILQCFAEPKIRAFLREADRDYLMNHEIYYLLCDKQPNTKYVGRGKPGLVRKRLQREYRDFTNLVQNLRCPRFRTRQRLYQVLESLVRQGVLEKREEEKGYSISKRWVRFSTKNLDSQYIQETPNRCILPLGSCLTLYRFDASRLTEEDIGTFKKLMRKQAEVCEGFSKLQSRMIRRRFQEVFRKILHSCNDPNVQLGLLDHLMGRFSLGGTTVFHLNRWHLKRDPRPWVAAIMHIDRARRLESLYRKHSIDFRGFMSRREELDREFLGETYVEASRDLLSMRFDPRRVEHEDRYWKGYREAFERNEKTVLKTGRITDRTTLVLPSYLGLFFSSDPKALEEKRRAMLLAYLERKGIRSEWMEELRDLLNDAVRYETVIFAATAKDGGEETLGFSFKEIHRKHSYLMEQVFPDSGHKSAEASKAMVRGR